MTESPCLVWLPMDHRRGGDAPHQKPCLIVGDNDARTVRTASEAQPVSFHLAAEADIPALLEGVDGVLWTESPFNMHPSHFREGVTATRVLLDANRHPLILEVVRACVNQHVPVLGLCGGFQEFNVALDATLHQQVHCVPGRTNPREPAIEMTGQPDAPGHALHLLKESVLTACAGANSIWVNYLHTRGSHELASGLRTLAVVPDGLVEAFELADAPAFTPGVQRRSQRQCGETPFYRSIFKRFGGACRARQRAHLASLES